MNQFRIIFTKAFGFCAVLALLILTIPACNPKYGCPSAEQANMSSKKKSKKKKGRNRSDLGFPGGKQP